MSQGDKDIATVLLWGAMPMIAAGAAYVIVKKSLGG